MVGKQITINIIANTIIEAGMSGGNRIFIECAKRWIKKGVKIRIYTSDAGKDLCLLNGLKNVDFVIWNLPYKKEKFSYLELILFYLLAFINGCINALKFRPQGRNEIIYSSSDYWPDSVPALMMKAKFPRLFWIAGFFLFAPKPWQKDSPYKGKRWGVGLLYWLTQLPIYCLVKRYAQVIFVTSKPDIKKFTTPNRSEDKIVTIRGGVDFAASTKVPEPKLKKYEAVFIGRFHPQKGVLELLDIWKQVMKTRPQAKLVMIGNGPLMEEVKVKIAKLNLEKNVQLFGFLDGNPKIKIFKSSKIVVHPATYDSGGMAACEAMAAGLPGVSFDLQALKTYYPKGMIKTPCFNLKAFSKNILRLLDDRQLHVKLKKEALDWAEKWDWDKNAGKLLRKIQRFTGG